MVRSIVTRIPGWRWPGDVHCYGERTDVTGRGNNFTARGATWHGRWGEGIRAETGFEERLALYNSMDEHPCIIVLPVNDSLSLLHVQ